MAITTFDGPIRSLGGTAPSSPSADDGTIIGAASISYSANTAAGTASATATYDGDANHDGSSASRSSSGRS